MCSQNVFCLVSMYEKINGSVWWVDVRWSRSTAEDWTWPVSASPLRWTEDRRPGRSRGDAGSQTTDRAGLVKLQGILRCVCCGSS